MNRMYDGLPRVEDIFKNADALIASGDYEGAYILCGEAKRYLQALQGRASRIVTTVATGAGVIGGIALPVIGNVIGAIGGSIAGGFIGKLVSTRCFYGANSVEELVELAGSGKRDCQDAMDRLKLIKKGKLPAGSVIYTQMDTLMQRYKQSIPY